MCSRSGRPFCSRSACRLPGEFRSRTPISSLRSCGSLARSRDCSAHYGAERARDLLEQQLRDRLELHVGRALVDRADLGVAVELLDGVVLGVTVPAVQLDAEGCHALAHLRGKELRHRRLASEGLSAVLDPRGVVNQEPRGLELRCGLRELELNSLKVRETRGELLPLLH